MASPIVLENPFLRVTLDGDTGAVIGITNRATDTEYLVPREHPQPPFIVDAYSANQAVYLRDPHEEQNGGFSIYNPETDADVPGDLRFLRAPERAAVSVEPVTGGRRAVCAYELPGGIHLTYTLTVLDDSPLTDWRVTVENRGAPAKRDDLRVYRIAFPVLDGLRIGDRHQDDFLARPYAQGELIPDPVSYHFMIDRTEDFWSPNTPLQKRTMTHVLTYLGWASMSWMDLYGPGGGLYLASCDPTFQQLDLEAWPDRALGAMTLDIRTYAFHEPGAQWESQRFTVGVHAGDWHWGADRYREWARAHHRPFAGPRWVRDECDGWFGTGGAAPYDDYLQMFEDAQWLGLNYLQIWSEMLENVGPDKSRKPYYCFLLPDPDRGGEAKLSEVVRKVRAAGGHIGFYYNIWTWDADIETGLRQWRDDIPPDVAIPTWWGGFRQSSSVFPNGVRLAYDYTHGYAGMCPASTAYQDYILGWVLERYVKRYGVDTWYFDSMPVGMLGAARVCFNDEHGPGHPHGIGRGILELLRRLTDGAKPYTNLAVTTETISDAQMQYASHALGIEMVGGLINHPKPEIYTYTFPDHPIFSGTCNGAGRGLVYYYPDMTDPRPEDAMNRVFLMGYRFDILARALDRENPFHQYLRALIALRQRIKADLYASDFRDDIGLQPLPDRLYARLFRHRDGSSMTITLLDRRAAPAPCALSLDLAPHNFTPHAATLYQLDGSETTLAAATAGNRLTLQIPSLTGEVAAIILR